MPIHEQERAYKRGVVLGLTLAEVIILLVFCLLLLFAVTQKIESRQNTGDEQTTMRQIAQEIDTMRNGQPLDLYWRELVRIHAEDRARRSAARSTPTDEELRRKVTAEMDELKGTRRLDEYWMELRRSLAEVQRKTEAASKLSDDKRKLEQELERGRVEVQRVTEVLGRAQEEVRRTRSELDKLRRETQARKGHSWPPIIPLKEAEGYSFNTGDASLTPAFEEKLRTTIVKTILEYVKEFDVDVIEIVGHTDEQAVRGTISNLDQQLILFLQGKRGASVMAADNAGLGMARAAAVTRFLRAVPELADFKDKIFPLSSAQVLAENQRLSDGVSNSGDRKERRRIEIRLRRSSTTTDMR